jgi:hypothetical protein
VINSYQNLNPGAKLDNFQTPKDFIRMVAYAIDGRYGDDKACLRTVRRAGRTPPLASTAKERKLNQKSLIPLRT